MRGRGWIGELGCRIWSNQSASLVTRRHRDPCFRTPTRSGGCSTRGEIDRSAGTERLSERRVLGTAAKKGIVAPQIGTHTIPPS